MPNTVYVSRTVIKLSSKYSFDNGTHIICIRITVVDRFVRYVEVPENDYSSESKPH